jgi:phosphate transport system permease protein
MSATDRRKVINKIVLATSTLFAVIGIFFLFWILFVLLKNGFEALNLSIFFNDGAPPLSVEELEILNKSREGLELSEFEQEELSWIEISGLRHAIIGQLMLAFGATLVGVPIGILAGTYVREYGADSKFANLIRDLSDVMMSAPSIVIGTFVYAIVVSPTGGFSGYAGIVALAIMMLPIILRTTDDMLGLVSNTLREAAIALGAPKYKMIMQVVYRGAKVGILTGILLAVARIAGETAPLLFTSFNTNFFETNLTEPIASLTVTMFNYATSPYEDWQQLGWAAALILAGFVLGLNIVGRVLLSMKHISTKKIFKKRKR